jgi:hypothetical protein
MQRFWYLTAVLAKCLRHTLTTVTAVAAAAALRVTVCTVVPEACYHTPGNMRCTHLLCSLR